MIRPRQTLRKWCVRCIVLCAAAYLLICLGCAGLQRRMIYAPPAFPPAQVQTIVQDARLEPWKTPDGKTIGWMRLSPTQPAKARVLLTHGNASCAFQCAHFADPIQQAAPFDVFALEYPGYAERSGKHTETTLKQAAAEALQALPPGSPIYVIGESLGTGVAAWLAGHYPDRVAGVVLFAPYNSLVDVAQAHIRILPAGLLLLDRFPALDDLKPYHGPLAVLAGGQDVVVPKRFALRLYDGYTGPKHLWEFPAASHDSLMFQPPAVWEDILTFLQTNRLPTQRSAYFHEGD